MTSNPGPTPGGSPVKLGFRELSPFRVLFLIVGILTARWIWIGGIGDYGWAYELGMRVWQGEVPYRDYISTLPQLTTYTIVPFLALLRGNLWAFAIHLYLWWLTSLVVGLLVARRLGLSTNTQAAGMFLAACVSFPAIHLGHAYSYAGTCFFGLVVLSLLNYRGGLGQRHLLAAGAFAGLAILAKQNIGAVAVVLALLVVANHFITQGRSRSVVGDVLWFLAGAAATFLPAFAYFAFHAGGQEVLRQMFLDAAEGKGGMISMVFHLLPFFFFTLETAHRHLWTLFGSGLLAAVFLTGFGFRMSRLQSTGASASAAGKRPPANSSTLLRVALGVVALLSALSLLDLPQLKSTLEHLHPRCIYACHGFVAPLIFVLYSALTAMSVVCLLSVEQWRKAELFLPTFALPLLLWGHELSCQGYLPFGAPLIIPLALFLLEEIGLIHAAARLACYFGMVVIFAQALSTPPSFQAPAFAPLRRLPEHSKFTHLWAFDSYATSVSEMLREVSPRIRNRRTLWLCVGGPHQAFEGRAVRSVAAMHGDTCNHRSELALMEDWQQRPPEFVFVGDFTPVPGARYLTKQAANLWLPQNYDRVWESSALGATLWQLRPGSNSGPANASQ